MDLGVSGARSAPRGGVRAKPCHATRHPEYVASEQPGD